MEMSQKIATSVPALVDALLGAFRRRRAGQAVLFLTLIGLFFSHRLNADVVVDVRKPSLVCQATMVCAIQRKPSLVCQARTVCAIHAGERPTNLTVAVLGGVGPGQGEKDHSSKGFAWRSAGNRRKMLEETGGTVESEAAVAAGLKWLAQHQAPDGHWSLDSFPQQGKCRCTGAGSLNNDIAGTALGLLPFLGAGKTHRRSAENPYQKIVDKGLKFLTSRQNANGYFGGGSYYAQGLATMAVCEAYGLTSDPALKRSAQQAISNIVSAQNANGGWDYLPGTLRTDTSVGGWQLMALKSGETAGLDVPKKATNAASRWLDRVMTNDGAGYGYDGPGDTNTMTGVGLLCREHLGWAPRNPSLIKGVEKLRTIGPEENQNNIYYCYYATQVLYHFGGQAWEKWNPKMRDILIAKQDKGANIAHQKGSWSPKDDAHGGAGGRLMVTSLSLLTLEVYYRYPPLHRRDQPVP